MCSKMQSSWNERNEWMNKRKETQNGVKVKTIETRKKWTENIFQKEKEKLKDDDNSIKSRNARSHAVVSKSLNSHFQQIIFQLFLLKTWN